MKDGIYFVVFRSNQQDVGNGTVVVKNGSVNGGDYGFMYQGQIDGDQLNLHVTQHDPQADSVFAGIKNFGLTLSLAESGHGYSLNGSIVGMPTAKISINAKFIGDAI